MTNSTINKIILSATTAMFLTACGGGGGSSTPTPTAAEIASTRIQAYAENGGTAPVLQDYIDAGVTGVTAANLDRYNVLVEARTGDDVDTVQELNDLVANIPDLPDREAPVIHLSGTTAVTVAYQGTYNDAGATVTDNKDTGLSVTVSGDTVDTDVPAVYVIKYDAVDAAGNHATQVIRTVTVTADPNTAPVATPQPVLIDEDTTDNAITLAGTDAENDALTYTIVTDPIHGALSGTAPAVTYTPNANFAGTDTFTFTVNDGKVDSAAATVTITVTDLPEIISPLKTGQTLSYNASGVEDNTILDDGHYKKGVTPSYTRDADTNTTTDNLTGLVWEDNARNTAYAATVAGFCDASKGWRIPTMPELKTLVNYSRVTPAIDKNFFIHEPDHANYYRTTDTATSINFGSGETKINRSDDRYIRCVKGTSAISDDFTRDSTTNTVTDNFRKLVWQDNPTGTEDAEVKTWTEAIDYCEGLSGDWRLPNINELESITERSGNNVKEGFDHINGYKSGDYWTSTTWADAGDQGKAWYIRYSTGAVTIATKARANNVRCVKDAN